MNIYSLYLIFFGLSTIVGVPLLSSFQLTQIKGSTWMDWVSSLGASLGPAAGIFVLVMIITMYVFKPLQRLLKEAKTRDLTDEEQILCQKTLHKINIISYLTIISGYFLGNGTTIVIKTLAGKVSYSGTDLAVIMVLIIVYGLMAVSYPVSCFNALAREQLASLKIHNTDKMKTSHFTRSLAINIAVTVTFVAWHVFCSGYGAVRNGWDSATFIRKGLYGLAVSVGAALPLAILILRQLAIRFGNTIKQVSQLRENGDLVTRLNIGTFDDFGVVMTEMNKLMDFLQAAFKKLYAEADKVGQDAIEMFMVSEQSSAGVSQVVSSYQNVQQQNDQKNALLRTTSENIEKLSCDAIKVSETMQTQATAEEQNAKAVEDMVNSIGSMTSLIKQAQTLSNSLTESSISGASEVEKTMTLIEGITEKSKKMVDVVKVIQQVASQTNLLAMNAAIEAAHAGETGKGFSVVAEEIRKLAENTQQQTKNINEIITEIVASIDDGSQSMKGTKEIFNKISEEISQQNEVVETISQNMDSQSASAQQVLSSSNSMAVQISEVNNLIQNQTRYTSEIKSNIESVVDLSEQVNQAMTESQSVMQDFALGINTVKDKANHNQEAVMNISEQLSSFKI